MSDVIGRTGNTSGSGRAIDPVCVRVRVRTITLQLNADSCEHYRGKLAGDGQRAQNHRKMLPHPGDTIQAHGVFTCVQKLTKVVGVTLSEGFLRIFMSSRPILINGSMTVFGQVL